MGAISSQMLNTYFFPLAIKEFFSKPKYNHILKPDDCLSEPCTILQLDMRTVQVADLEVRRDDPSFLPHVIILINELELLLLIFPVFLIYSDFVFSIFRLFSL